jgi:hypothetical protein
MGRVDDDSPRARLDAAVELYGVDLILECETRRQSPQSARPRSETMEQERVAPPSLRSGACAESCEAGTIPRTANATQTRPPNARARRSFEGTTGFFST